MNMNMNKDMNKDTRPNTTNTTNISNINTNNISNNNTTNTNSTNTNTNTPRIKYTIDVIATRKKILLSDRQTSNVQDGHDRQDGQPQVSSNSSSHSIDNNDNSNNSSTGGTGDSHSGNGSTNNDSSFDPLVTYTLTTHVNYIPNNTQSHQSHPLPKDEIFSFHNGSKLCTDCMLHYNTSLIPTNGVDLYVVGSKR